MLKLSRIALALILCALHPACGDDKTTITQGGSGELGNSDPFPETGNYLSTFDKQRDDCDGNAQARIVSRVEYWREGSDRIRFVVHELGPDSFRGSLTPGPSAGTWRFTSRADALFGLPQFSATMDGDLSVMTIRGTFVASQTVGCPNGAGSTQYGFTGPRQ